MKNGVLAIFYDVFAILEALLAFYGEKYVGIYMNLRLLKHQNRNRSRRNQVSVSGLNFDTDTLTETCFYSALET